MDVSQWQRGDNADSQEQVPSECDRLQSKEMSQQSQILSQNSTAHRYRNENRGMGRTLEVRA